MNPGEEGFHGKRPTYSELLNDHYLVEHRGKIVEQLTEKITSRLWVKEISEIRKSVERMEKAVSEIQKTNRSLIKSAGKAASLNPNFLREVLVKQSALLKIMEKDFGITVSDKAGNKE